MKSCILFGFKSCGKTHFGKLLSKELHLPFIDTDVLLEKTYPDFLSTNKMYARLGKEKFRALEKEVILKIPKHPPSVIALGGGAVLNLESVAHLKTLGTLIYLKIDLQTAKERILSKPLPAFLDRENPEASLEKVYLERLPLYEAIAGITIDTNRMSQNEILHTLVTSLLGSLSSKSIEIF